MINTVNTKSFLLDNNKSQQTNMFLQENEYSNNTSFKETLSSQKEVKKPNKGEKNPSISPKYKTNSSDSKRKTKQIEVDSNGNRKNDVSDSVDNNAKDEIIAFIDGLMKDLKTVDLENLDLRVTELQNLVSKFTMEKSSLEVTAIFNQIKNLIENSNFESMSSLETNALKIKEIQQLLQSLKSDLYSIANKNNEASAISKSQQVEQVGKVSNLGKKIPDEDGKFKSIEFFSNSTPSKGTTLNPKDIASNLESSKNIDFLNIKNQQVEDFRNINLVESKQLAQNVPKFTNNSIYNQIIESAKLSLTDETSEMYLKLKPDNLGNLSMKIVIERGMLVAKFDVESQTVKQAIESNLEDLRNTLSDKGFAVQEFNVSVNQNSKENTNPYLLLQGKKKLKRTSLNQSQILDNSTYMLNQPKRISLNSTIDFLA